MSDYWSYNLPGFGLVRVRLFPRARRVFDFLEEYDHIKHLKGLDQLGPIRQVLPGAHHTRYEYLMAQLAIITELCHLRGQLPVGLSLGRDRATFGVLDGVDGEPSNGEILMVLAMLGNIGHLPSTFSGERALMKYLRDHRAPRQAFRLGLPEEDREEFDTALARDNLYQFNYYIAAFLLNRYRRRDGGSSVVEFCQAVLRSFIHTRGDDPDQGLVQLWNLYRSLRRLTYLALDSHYAPVPFSLDLGSIFFSLEHFLADVFSETSSFQAALQRIEGVLRDTVYMGPEQLLNHARVGDEVLKELEALDPEPSTIGAFWDLLGPDRQVDQHFTAPDPTNEHALRHRRVVQLNYDVDPTLAARLLPDPIAWERGARSAAGLRSCSFAADFDPLRRHLKVTAGLSHTVQAEVARKASHRVAKQLVDFERKIDETGAALSPASVTRNGMSLLRFLLSELLGPERRLRLRTMPAVESAPVIRTYGSTRAADRVRDYKVWAKTSGLFDNDQLNEVEQLENTLRKVDYRGALLAFAGSTEVIEGEEILAEFDGIVVFLSREIDQPTLLVIEAKNMQGGHTAAEAQLRERFGRLKFPDGAYSVHHLGTKGAYAAVTVQALPV